MFYTWNKSGNVFNVEIRKQRLQLDVIMDGMCTYQVGKMSTYGSYIPIQFNQSSLNFPRWNYLCFNESVIYMSICEHLVS